MDELDGGGSSVDDEGDGSSDDELDGGGSSDEELDGSDEELEAAIVIPAVVVTEIVGGVPTRDGVQFAT